MSESDQRRVIVLVVGVTPHRGDGSAVTGRRITGNFVQSLVSIEVLDLMNDPLRELEHLGKLASADQIIRMDGMRSRRRARQKVTGELGAATSVRRGTRCWIIDTINKSSGEHSWVI